MEARSKRCCSAFLIYNTYSFSVVTVYLYYAVRDMLRHQKRIFPHPTCAVAWVKASKADSKLVDACACRYGRNAQHAVGCAVACMAILLSSGEETTLRPIIETTTVVL